MKLSHTAAVGTGRMSAGRALRAAIAVSGVCALLVSMLPQGKAQAQLLREVGGLTVTQHDGFAALAWDPLEGATEYQIERTPVDDQNLPIGLPVVVGVWRPNRQVNPGSPTFADAGFTPGDRFQWRVRADNGLFSDPAFGTTLPPSGPEEFLTQFETTGGAQYTSYESEIEWTYALAEASDRVRVETLGHTALGREINLFVVGYPTPPASAAEISASPAAAAGCVVHGNEPSGREACFMMIRHMAFSDDPWVIDILSHATVLFIPSLNGDGRAANTRGNSTGQDLNRDYGRLSQPETQALVRFWRDYTPDVMTDHHHFGDTNTCDLSLMNTPQLNNAEATYNEAKLGLIEGWMYDQGAVHGWWPCPYPVAFSPGGQSFGNTAGMKHIIGMLVESRASGGTTRPDEASTQNNRRRMAYSHLWTIRQALDYHRANLPRIQQAIADSLAFQTSNTGRVVFDGTYDWPAFPPPHPGENPPPNNRPGPGDVLETPPCGYLLTEQQYSTPRNDGGSLPAHLRTSPEQRLDFHGIRVVPWGTDHYFVPMAQPLRALIPLILDGQAQQLGIPIIVAADRVSTCYPTVEFSSPSANPPGLTSVNAGSSVPVKFSLGGDRGMSILADGAPSSREVDCSTLAAVGTPESTEAAHASELQFDAETNEYTYVWKTSKRWGGTCREFALGLDDGTSHPAYFHLKTGK